MSLQNAEKNIQKLSKTLNLAIPSILETKGCALKSEGGLILQFYFEESTDTLFLYSTVLQGLPKEEKKKADLYATLLEYQLLFVTLSDGKIGIDPNQDVILFLDKVSMKEEGEDQLNAKFPTFYRMSLAWKDLAAQTLSGKPPKMPEPPKTPPASSSTGGIKI